MDEHTRTVNLPVRIVDRVEERLPRAEWDTLEEYITYVMEEVQIEQETGDDDCETLDEDEVKCLKLWGYLNE